MKRPSLNKWGAAALGFALLVTVAAGSLGLHMARGLHLETGLLALLPQNSQQPLADLAIQRMADSASKRVLLLFMHADPEQAGKSADAAAAALLGKPGIASVTAKIEGDFAGKARDFYFPWRYRLLSDSQRQRLSASSDEAILGPALEALYSPMGPPRLAALEEDPLGLFSEGLLEAASRSPLRMQEGRLSVAEGSQSWILVLVELSEGSASMADQKALLKLFDSAADAARAASNAEQLRAGFVFHSAGAARRAEAEMKIIGLGSTAGILLLIFWAFRSFKPLLLVLLPILIGCLCAVGLSLLLFEKLHVLTLVFGSSIIGVAVDYGVIFVAGSAGPLHWDAPRRRREILRPVSMAIATSLLAYATLAALPFPILRQMGAFTMLGLASAWLCAMLWLPLLARTMPDASQTSASRGLLWVKAHWPRFGKNRGFSALLLLAALIAAAGLFKLKSNDDVRQLYASSPEAVRQQEKVQQLMKLPSSGRFFLVRGADEQQLLQREEALCASLEKSGIRYQAVSQFVPSLERQAADQALQFRRVYAPKGLASKLFKRLDSPEVARQARALALKKTPDLLPEAWLQSPMSTPFRPLWLGKQGEAWASVVTLTDEARPLDLPGVDYVDHLADLGRLMGAFRARIGWILVGGYGIVSLFLLAVYKKEAWRILLPTLLASLFVAGLFGWLGLNYNLFCVFGILMSLDMGVDYGIFMQDSRSGDYKVSLLSSSLSALSTLLSFGLLALSHTPALQIFGLSVLLGIGGSWLLAPCFSKGE